MGDHQRGHLFQHGHVAFAAVLGRLHQQIAVAVRKRGQDPRVTCHSYNAISLGKRQVMRGVVGVDLVAQHSRGYANQRPQRLAAALVFMHRQIGRSGDVHFLIS
ncbi:hypothetical protein D3C85_1253870 [compost metagenome]